MVANLCNQIVCKNHWDDLPNTHYIYTIYIVNLDHLTFS